MFLRSPAVLGKRTTHRSATISLDIDRLDFRSALVIEESTLLRGQLVDYLKKRGWIAHGIKRVEQAEPLLKCISYHLIVIDSNLPGIGAANFVRMLHSSKDWSTIPLVVITDSANETFASDRNRAVPRLARRTAWLSDLTNILAGLESHSHWKREPYAN
jgi:CheY-like chemotaxis protein